MSKKYSGFIVSGIGVVPDTDLNEVYAIAAAELKRAGVSPARLCFSVYKRSVDARKRDRITITMILRKESTVTHTQKAKNTVSKLKRCEFLFMEKVTHLYFLMGRLWGMN